MRVLDVPKSFTRVITSGFHTTPSMYLIITTFSSQTSYICITMPSSRRPRKRCFDDDDLSTFARTPTILQQRRALSRAAEYHLLRSIEPQSVQNAPISGAVGTGTELPSIDLDIPMLEFVDEQSSHLNRTLSSSSIGDSSDDDESGTFTFALTFNPPCSYPVYACYRFSRYRHCRHCHLR